MVSYRECKVDFLTLAMSVLRFSKVYLEVVKLNKSTCYVMFFYDLCPPFSFTPVHKPLACRLEGAHRKNSSYRNCSNLSAPPI